MRSQTMGGAVLFVLTAAYVGIAGLELVRILRFEPPARYAAGVFPWEVTPACYRLRSDNFAGSAPFVDAGPGCVGTPRVFRWTGEHARLLEPVAGPLLIVPINASRPDIEDGIALEITVDGVPLDVVILREGGWQELAYYLPPVLGESVGSVLQGQPETSGAGGSRPSSRAGWLEMTPWAPGSVVASRWVEFTPSSTFVPAQTSPTDDQRRLGIGVGQLRWETVLPADGIGFHAWEDDDGAPFRWTRRRASMPLRARGASLDLRLRADHPDIEAQPVEVAVFWDARLLGTVVLTDNAWTPRSFIPGVPAGSEGVLSVHVARVWTPAVAGVSDDFRALGVAISGPEWR